MIVFHYHFLCLICRLLFLLMVGHNRASSRRALGKYVAKPSTLVTTNQNKNINEKITDKHNVVAVQIRGKGSFPGKCPRALTSLSRGKTKVLVKSPASSEHHLTSPQTQTIKPFGSRLDKMESFGTRHTNSCVYILLFISMKYRYQNFDRSYNVFSYYLSQDFDIAIVIKLKLRFVSFDQSVSCRYLSKIYMIKHNTSSSHSLQSCAVCNLIIYGSLGKKPQATCQTCH